MFFSCAALIWAQGLVQDGVTLYGPREQTDTHLLDSSGKTIHTWQGANAPGEGLYLKPNGNLLRTYHIPGFLGSNINGSGGGLREFSWDGTLLWDFQIANNTQQAHHDIAILPNGNIVMLVFENIGKIGAIAAGRNPATLVSPYFLSETLVEINPTTNNVVWEWTLWDHLIQDFDPNQANYGVVSDHPEWINLNFPAGSPTFGDWVHCNGVDYNQEFDQLVISSRSFSEIWVIDHANPDSDILYRWGNPAAYGRGNASDQQLFKQHDPTWIPKDRLGGGNLLIFNNGNGRPGGDSSSVEEIVLPVDNQGNYSIPSGGTYGPALPIWTWADNPPSNSFSKAIGGCERQPNGNTLITIGVAGHIIETDPGGKQVWDWRSPNGEMIFKARRYQKWLWPGDATLSIATGGTVALDLAAGKYRANRPYRIAGTLSGTSPGTDLGNGVIAPLNWDSFSDWTMRNVNGPLLNNFSGVLDSNGFGTAVLDTLGPVSSSYSGLTAHFAFVLLKPLDFVSNAIPVLLLP